MRALAWIPFVLSASTAFAQASNGVATGAATITAADVQRRVAIIADDSMMGRDTPSRGLDLTAQYVAAEFKRFGLKPGGDDGTFFQRYPIQRTKLDLAKSQVVLRAGSSESRAPLASAARFLTGGVPKAPVTGPAVVIGGTVAPEDVTKMPVADRIVLYVFDYSKPQPQNAFQVLRALRVAGARAIVAVANQDSATFAARVPKEVPERTSIDMGMVSPPVVEIWEGAVAPALRAAGLDLATFRSAASAVAKELPALTIRVDLTQQVLATMTAPNTIGILEGSDPTLKGEYVVYSAHMDHVGTAGGGSCAARGADSICNGADDDASGTIGVVELAEAFSQPGARPKRSVIFMTVSGEEKGLWGSRYFSEHPTVPLANVVANINLDMIGRNWADTIVAIGKEHSDLGATLNRVNAAHPELKMTAIDDIWPAENFYFRSDHYNFARKGVPILFFFNGTHDDYHQVGDSPDKINGEKEARIVKLLFYLGQEVGNAAERPKWNPASKKQIVETT